MPDEKCILDPQRDCLGLTEARRLEQEIKSIQERNGADHKEFREEIREIREMTIQQASQFSAILQTMGEIKQDNKEMIRSIQELKPKAEAVDELEDDVKRLNNEVKEIHDKPAKNWEELKGKMLWGIVGVIAAALGAGIIRLLAMGV